MGCLKLTEVYTPHLFPFLILFISLDKYLDLVGDVLSSLIQPKQGEQPTMFTVNL